MNVYCTIGEALEEIKEMGANISATELRDIAHKADLPYRRGAGRTLLYRSDDLLKAFNNSFMRPSEILALARSRQRRGIA